MWNRSIGLGNRFVLSGSATDAAWLAIVDEVANSVVDVRKILPKPFKHAGGFQINDGWMAVGVEDNRRRDRSRVLIYDVDAADGIPEKPATVIERSGPRERATAGAVGVARFEARLWVVVGNWDSRHLDFYVTNEGALAFEPALTLEPDANPKDGWVESEWYGYQNLNLFEDNGELYLIGTTSLDDTTEVADLFQLNLNGETPSLVKNRHHRLARGSTTRLRWGGGIERTPSGQLRLYATEDTLNQATVSQCMARNW